MIIPLCVRQPGVRTHYVEMGSGPPVLLCHGFPESWYSWRYQVTCSDWISPESLDVVHVYILKLKANTRVPEHPLLSLVDPGRGSSRVQGVGSGHEGVRRVHSAPRCGWVKGQH